MSFKRHIRLEVFNKYSGRCAYCGCTLHLHNFQIDHIIPEPKNNNIANLNPSCRRCNFFKSNLTPSQFRTKLEHYFYVVQHKTPKITLLKSFNLIHFRETNVIFYYENFQ